MTSANDNTLAGRTVRGSLYNVLASAVTILFGFVRTTLLLRLLPASDFGVAALALFYLDITAHLHSLGLNTALIHRKEPDERVLSTFFSLNMGLTLLGTLLLTAVTPLLGRLYPNYPLLPPVLYAYIAINLVKGFNMVQETILSKQLAFRSIALIDISSSLVMTLVAPYLAWRGWGVWAIVMERFSGIAIRTLLIWLFYRRWQPRLGWDKEIARWFWQFGIRSWASGNLTYLIDRFDDFWIGTFLGRDPLGFYSRAYEYARYPRRVVANPILDVFFPTYAQLQDEPVRLSRAFFRATSLMLRIGCLFSLIFILTAPEFIRILLTDRWLPMLVTFQLMIVYTLLDPLSLSAMNLLLATGHPGQVTRVRFWQMVIFVPTVAGLGSLWGIEGVALAADIMILVGAIFLFQYVGRLVDYSARALWLWPLVGTAVTATVVLLLNPFWATLSLWVALIGKAGLITILFLGLLWLTEREQLLVGWQMVWSKLRPQSTFSINRSDVG